MAQAKNTKQKSQQIAVLERALKTLIVKTRNAAMDLRVAKAQMPEILQDLTETAAKDADIAATNAEKIYLDSITGVWSKT